MDTPVIDFHCHAGRWGPAPLDDDPDRFLAIMDAAGIDMANLNCIFYGDHRRDNDIVAGFVAKYPERFIGVAFVTPHSPDEAVLELERCFDDLGMRSLKIYPDYVGVPIDDPAYFAIFEWADDRGIVVMSHARFPFDREGVTIRQRFTTLSGRYPRIRWVLAHAAGRQDQDAVHAALASPNVFLETCSSGSALGAVEFAVNGAGADKVLFGTDLPIMDPRQQLAKVATANISLEAKRKVLGLNAARLLGLEL